MASPLTLRAAPACARGARQRRARGSSKSTLEATTSSSSLLVVPRAFVSNRSGSNSIADPKEVLLNDAEFLLDAHEKLVSAFNPHAAERLEEDLLIEIGALQAALDEAAEGAAEAEAALRASLADLSELEAKARALSSSAGFSAAPPAEAAAPAVSAPPAVESEQRLRSRRGAPSSSSTSSSSSSSSPAALLAAAGLSASLHLSPRLREFWHPVAFSRDVKRDAEVTFDLFDATWVLRRDEEEEGGGSGGASLPRCVLAPTPSAAVLSSQTWPDAPPSLPTRERDGLIWAWPGSGQPPPEEETFPAFAAPPEGYTVHAELTMDVPVDSGLLLENLLDLAHAPFTHTGTFAKGWPVPDAVTFRAREALGGVWDPYPIDMSFAPPCATLSLIGMRAPGAVARSERQRGEKSSTSSSASSSRHLHQMHVVLPSGPGRVRLLYRMSLDFWPWAAKLPLATKLWRTVADRVLGEDLVLVAGQQDRLVRGADVWANPVPYDKLGVRCRRWRNAVAAGDERAARLALPSREQSDGGNAAAGVGGFISARELLFATEDES